MNGNASINSAGSRQTPGGLRRRVCGLPRALDTGDLSHSLQLSINVEQAMGVSASGR
jgi:hypothetical protein